MYIRTLSCCISSIRRLINHASSHIVIWVSASILSASPLFLYAQEKVQVEMQAQELEGGTVDGVAFRRLRGNVQFTLEELTIYAEHATFYDQENRIEVTDQVKIVTNDGATLIAESLVYDINTKLAKLRGQVVYQDSDLTFQTDHLAYQADKNCLSFSQGGTLMNKDTVVISESGSYDRTSKEAIFQTNVHLTHQAHELRCDKLSYNTHTRIAQLEGGDEKIVTKSGQNILTTQAELVYKMTQAPTETVQSLWEVGNYRLYADLVWLDRDQETYKALGNVRLTTPGDDLIISGQHGVYQQKERKIEIYGDPLMEKKLADDHAYLTAERFVMQEVEDEKGETSFELCASHNAKLYSNALQGCASTIRYHSATSTIQLGDHPIFWSYGNQITATKAAITLEEQTLKSLQMTDEVFLVSEDLGGNYNQLKGRTMTATFADNAIHQILIEGNAESLYFVIDEQTNPVTFIGMNHIQCSHIEVKLQNKALTHILFQVKPIGTFYPPAHISEESKQLLGFQWQPEKRPSKEAVLGRGYGQNKAIEHLKLK